MKTKSSLQRFFRNRKVSMVIAIAVGQIALASNALAATYYVATNGNNSSTGSSTAPFQTIQKGLSVLAPGDTLVIRDGTYSGSSNSFTSLPNGSSGQYITIMAENEGNVIITGGLTMADDDQYIVIQGIRFQDSGEKNIRGHHLKFFRNEFKGGPSNGNGSTLILGTNDRTPGSQYVLLEDNWLHGMDGRYKVLVYNSDSIILRRIVTRFDGNHSIDNAPEADIAVYDSSNVEVQNSITMDGTTGSLAANYLGAFYSVCNGTTSTSNTNRFFRGSIAINSGNYLMGTEGQCSTMNQQVIDVASYGGKYGVSQLKGTNIQYTRLTIVKPTGDGFGIFGGSVSIKDSIVANATGKAFNGASPLTSIAYNNAGGNTGGTVMNPFVNGLSYLPRIEANSTLSSGGTGGGQRGAWIVKRIGIPGTLYGEAGYADTTTTDLWPFPNEARIKKEMCSDAGVTRGFCSSKSLTEYIYTFLNNPNPYSVDDTTTLLPPTNLKVL